MNDLPSLQHLLIFGGSFDPPHYGHIKTAQAIQNHFHFDRFVFLPCKTPLLKNTTIASAAQRLTMLRRALPNTFQIDCRELQRNTPSYTVETLQSIREEVGTVLPITLLLGEDAFAQLPAWHHWETLLSLAHLLVIKRKGAHSIKDNRVLQDTLHQHEVFEKKALLTRPSGCIFRFDAGNYPISSTEVRAKLIANECVNEALPPDVYTYIQQEGLYRAV